MNEVLEYRENCFFSEGCTYFYSNNLNKIKESKVVFEKGNWFLDNYKATSVKCVRKLTLKDILNNYYI
jgi:hypothetical protein